MSKQGKTSKNSVPKGGFGVSTSADVRAFRAANAAFAARVMSTKESAQAYVRKLERKVGLTPTTKK